MRVLLFFVDGLGLGVNDALNPLKNRELTFLTDLLESKYCIPTDATLDVDGLPQSATGQTAILTGKNAAKIVGRHINGFPTKTLKQLIQKHSILKRLKEHGFNVTNANMYTKEYLDKIRLEPNRLNASATTLATLAAQLPFRLIEDMLAQKAVFQDITNEILLERGYDVPLRTPIAAGKILAQLSKEFDFVLYEYFQTDLAGHSKDRNRCEKVLRDLNEMLEGLLTNMDFERSLLILTSDHGNIEDLSTPSHTLNKVPTVLKGKNEEKLADKIKSICDIAPAIEELLLKENNKLETLTIS